MVDFGVESIGQSECMGQQEQNSLENCFFFYIIRSVIKIIFRFFGISQIGMLLNNFGDFLKL